MMPIGHSGVGGELVAFLCSATGPTIRCLQRGQPGLPFLCGCGGAAAKTHRQRRALITTTHEGTSHSPGGALHSAGTAHLPLTISFISHLPLPLRLATVRYFHPPSEGHPGCLFCVWFSQWGELNHQARIQAAVPTAIEVGLRSLPSECATQ